MVQPLPSEQKTPSIATTWQLPWLQRAARQGLLDARQSPSKWQAGPSEPSAATVASLALVSLTGATVGLGAVEPAGVHERATSATSGIKRCSKGIHLHRSRVAETPESHGAKRVCACIAVGTRPAAAGLQSLGGAVTIVPMLLRFRYLACVFLAIALALSGCTSGLASKPDAAGPSADGAAVDSDATAEVAATDDASAAVDSSAPVDASAPSDAGPDTGSETDGLDGGDVALAETTSDCTTAKAFAKCDDNNPCTVGDACFQGACQPGTNICKCSQDVDCASLEDGSLCNGSLFCDVSSGNPAKFACKLNPATAIVCSKAKDTTCSVNTCDEASGKCAQKPVFGANVPCDDGNDCSTGDACADGKCVSGVKTCVCTTNSDCASQEDGDACNGTLFCNLTLNPPGCMVNPATVVTCSIGLDGQCLRTVCNPKTGTCSTLPVEKTVKKKAGCQEAAEKCAYVAAPADAPPVYPSCDDGNPCTQDESCAKGKCLGTYICPCQKDADCVDLDGDVCTGTPFCDKALGACKTNPATVVACPTAADTACAKNECAKLTGKCAMTATKMIDLPCDDGNACTVGDVCGKLTGLCEPGVNTCPCKANADCAAVANDNLCKGVLYCDLTATPHACVANPGSAVVCTSVFDTECRTNTCDKKSGQCAMLPVFGFKPCTDGNPCTVGDTCEQGDCVAGPNTCECQKDSDCAKIEDTDACNGTLFCDKTAKPFHCSVDPKTVVACPTGPSSQCSLNECDPASGACKMVAASPFASCEDGNPCTKGDHCASGKCSSGANGCPCQLDAECGQVDDDNLCNGKLFCDKTQGACVPAPGTLVTCASGNDAECKKNTCVSSTGTCALSVVASACDDGNPCTADSCGAAGKCGHSNVSDGLSCGGDKVCKSGQCSSL